MVRREEEKRGREVNKRAEENKTEVFLSPQTTLSP